MTGLLAGKRAVVTGSSRGMGRAYALALAREGASVAINGTTPGLVDEVVAEIRAGGGQAVGWTGSVATFEGAERLIATAVEGLGGVDILINNAGITRERMVFNMTDDEFRASMDVDYFGTFACSRHASRVMRAQGWGRIINTGDTSALHGLLGGTGVGAAKGGVTAMTYTWALELQRYGITVNCIIPYGYTRMHDPLLRKTVEVAQQRGDTDVPTFEQLVAEAPKPEETTGLLVYLASAEADWITGQVFSMQRDRIALWSRPIEKATLTSTKPIELEDLRANARRAFGNQLEAPAPPPEWTHP